MEVIGIIIPSMLYLLFFALGIFIIIQNPQKRVFWYLGGALFCGGLYILCLIITRLELSQQQITIVWKFMFIPDEIATMLWTLAAIQFFNEFSKKIKINIIFTYLIVTLNFILLFLLTFTSTFIDYSSPILINNKYIIWDFNYKNLALLRSAFIWFKLLFVIFLYLKLILIFKSSKLGSFLKIILIASLLLLIGTIINQIHDFFRTRHPSLYAMPIFIPEIFFLFAMILISWVLLNPKMRINEVLEIAKDFISYIGYGLFVAIPYIILIILTSNIFGGKYFTLISSLIILGLAILTHSTHEWIIELIRRSIKNKRIIIPSILHSDINFVIKNYSVPNKLQYGKLIKLEKIEKTAKQNKISKIDALRKLIEESIEYFKPKDKGDKRTPARLKYEILYMIAFEGATESQIMWDLGFDTYTRSVEEKLSDQRSPRFELKDASEYSATSIRSFKRLKKEAIEMLRWRLE